MTYGQTDKRTASCAGDREFESQAGQISYSVANGSPPLQHLRKLSWRYDAEMGIANSLHASV